MNKIQIIKNLFENNEIELEKGITPWADTLYNKLIDWYDRTNSSINDIDYTDNYTITKSDDLMIITIYAYGDDGEYNVSIYLLAGISDDFTTVSNCNYDIEKLDKIELEEEE